jgi:hypothetical protein
MGVGRLVLQPRDFFRSPLGVKPPADCNTPKALSALWSQFGPHPQSFCYTPFKLKSLGKSLLQPRCCHNEPIQFRFVCSFHGQYNNIYLQFGLPRPWIWKTDTGFMTLKENWHWSRQHVTSDSKPFQKQAAVEWYDRQRVFECQETNMILIKNVSIRW